jgi:hypothetical protein
MRDPRKSEEIMSIRRYLLPVFLVASILGVFFVIENRRPKHAQNVQNGSGIMEIFEPHGRALYLVVDVDGYYVGDEFVPFILLDKYLKEHADELRPDCGFVCGTQSCRYGRVIEAVDSIRAIFRVDSRIITRAIPDGKRHIPIEQHENPWEYD